MSSGGGGVDATVPGLISLVMCVLVLILRCRMLVHFIISIVDSCPCVILCGIES